LHLCCGLVVRQTVSEKFFLQFFATLDIYFDEKTSGLVYNKKGLKNMKEH